jgi:hypothetical protein
VGKGLCKLFLKALLANLDLGVVLHDPLGHQMRCVKDVRQSGSFFSVRQQREAAGFLF